MGLKDRQRATHSPLSQFVSSAACNLGLSPLSSLDHQKTYLIDCKRDTIDSLHFTCGRSCTTTRATTRRGWTRARRSRDEKGLRTKRSTKTKALQSSRVYCNQRCCVVKMDERQKELVRGKRTEDEEKHKGKGNEEQE